VLRSGRSRSRRLLVTAAFVVLVGVLVGVSEVGRGGSAAQARPSAGAARNAATGVCDSVRIKGTSQNDTGMPMHVTQDGHALSNQWCRVPEDQVRAHSSNTWHIADNTAPVSMHIVYRLHNGDEILFQAELRKPEGTKTGCSFVEVVRTPRQFECKAEATSAGTDFAHVKFIVLPRQAPGPTSR
jgi:hypothetical protein